tara:strand:- start:103 stop:225 length:123 start_codon:yes stop_codon:yes gene_type:complete
MFKEEFVIVKERLKIFSPINLELKKIMRKLKIIFWYLILK